MQIWIFWLDECSTEDHDLYLLKLRANSGGIVNRREVLHIVDSQTRQEYSFWVVSQSTIADLLGDPFTISFATCDFLYVCVLRDMNQWLARLLQFSSFTFRCSHSWSWRRRSTFAYYHFSTNHLCKQVSLFNEHVLALYLNTAPTTYFSSERNYDLCCDSSRQYSLAPTIFFLSLFLYIFIILVRLFVCNYISELARIKCSKDHNCDSTTNNETVNYVFSDSVFFTLHFSSKQLFGSRTRIIYFLSLFRRGQHESRRVSERVRAGGINSAFIATVFESRFRQNQTEKTISELFVNADCGWFFTSVWWFSLNSVRA